MVSDTAVAQAQAEASEVSEAALRILSDYAPSLVPVLYEVGEKTWPRERQYTRKRWGSFGPQEIVREDLPRRFEVLLRKRDLATARLCWRLEAAGPVGFFEWDDSGRIHGTYGVRYGAISIAPVLDEAAQLSGFALNARPSAGGEGALCPIDARIGAADFVRTTGVDDLVNAVRLLVNKARIEESRPGMEPTRAFFETMRLENKVSYFNRRGANEYVGKGWTPVTIRDAFRNPTVRALVIGHPDEPSQTPEPAEH